MSTVVAIAGSGLAELTCAWLLAGRGHRVRPAADAPAAGARPLLLTGPTLELLGSLWGDGLLHGTWRLDHRQVRWGTGERPTRFAQPARVVDGAVLAARMRERLATALGPSAGTARWVVTARSPDGPGSRLTAGRRHLLAGTAPLRSGTDERTALLDTTALGWLQLTPLGAGRCLVQAMVPGPAEDPTALLTRLLAASGLGRVLRHAPRAAAAVPAAPRLHHTPALSPGDLTPAGRITVGAGAIRFDPLSGTGTAQALRTAVLAAAVIDADAGGAPVAPLCRHLTDRLRAAFAEHLATCAALYGSALTSVAWQDELDAARLGSPAPGRAVAPV
ncbi:hypothetical protein J7I94_15970 [Streptomyces sp. ISL-12]|uniref:hypothetical protein n=1 Tax=Streptomyces sp. ISL-12 TaxID=2819177 RepID=UPI001BEB6C7F|nr:hypothetical protein [Streptomyces sp. ISL-12]MBT2412048.1 hypothetical protein [Streptomyces sp. ISL-12]